MTEDSRHRRRRKRDGTEAAQVVGQPQEFFPGEVEPLGSGVGQDEFGEPVLSNRSRAGHTLNGGNKVIGGAQSGTIR